MVLASLLADHCQIIYSTPYVIPQIKAQIALYPHIHCFVLQNVLSIKGFFLSSVLSYCPALHRGNLPKNFVANSLTNYITVFMEITKEFCFLKTNKAMLPKQMEFSICEID